MAELKEYRTDNGRVVSIADEIYNGSYLSFKKDLYDIINSDEEVFKHNYDVLCRLDKKTAETYKNNIKFPPIYIDICSEGGSAYHGIGMYDLLRRASKDTRHEFIARIDGLVASAATIIMLGCDKRIAAPNTSFLVHSVATITAGKLEDLKEELEELDRVSAVTKKIYVERTSLTEEKLLEIDKMKKDWWIKSDEALEYGLITDIG